MGIVIKACGFGDACRRTDRSHAPPGCPWKNTKDKQAGTLRSGSLPAPVPPWPVRPGQADTGEAASAERLPRIEPQTLNLNSSSLSDSDSLNINGSEKAISLPSPLEAEFIAHFGGFNGKRERERWQTLSEAIGFPRLQEIADWAEKREIHMTNRGALLDSLETAAKKWIDNNPKPKGDNTEFFKNLAVAAEVKI